MWRLTLLVAVCSCNEVFGLHATREIDAQQFDATTDAPPNCPPIGTVPEFARRLHQAVTQNCVNYTSSESANVAVAYCLDVDQIADGEVDGPLSPSTFVPAVNGSEPRLTPEGDEMWIRQRTNTPIFTVYKHDSSHTWLKLRDLTVVTSSQDDSISAPTRRGPGGRRFVRYAFAEFRLYEYLDDGTTATPVHVYTTTALGVQFLLFPNLSADGLRLTFVGALQSSASSAGVTLYADRASLSDLFVTAVAIPSAPVVDDPFLTADCGRLYTSGLGSIFYAQLR